jgi:superkiller protein 3
MDDAAAAYQQTLALNDNAMVRSQLASVYVYQGKADAAIAEYQKAIVLDPQNGLLRLGLGNLYKDLGKLDEAAAEYRAALAIQLDSPEARFGLAVVEYKRCNLTTATQAMNTAVSLRPGLSLYRGALAAMYLAQGRSDDAAKGYAGLQAAPASDAIAHWLAGEYLFRTGKLDDAAREFQLVLETSDLVPVMASVAHNALGQVYYAQDRLTPAESAFRLALDTFPASAEAMPVARSQRTSRR